MHKYIKNLVFFTNNTNISLFIIYKFLKDRIHRRQRQKYVLGKRISFKGTRETRVDYYEKVTEYENTLENGCCVVTNSGLYGLVTGISKVNSSVLIKYTELEFCTPIEYLQTLKFTNWTKESVTEDIEQVLYSIPVTYDSEQFLGIIMRNYLSYI